MNVKPNAMLKIAEDYQKNIRKAKSLVVAVGLPKGTATSKIYENGETVVSVGAKHEYGIGVPQRSFLRVPFKTKEKELATAIKRTFQSVVEKGEDAVQALEKVGIAAEQVSKKAFTNDGYGTWKPLSQRTIFKKGSSRILVDTKTLGNSITSEVRKK